MRIRNRVYSNPVLFEGNGCYENSYFKSECTCIRDGFDIVISIKVHLKNKVLESLLSGGDITIVHHFECAKTFFRKEIETGELEYTARLRERDVNGVVEIVSLLVAAENISDYTNDLLTDDYREFKYYFDKGSILAIGNQYNLRVEKMKDDLADSSSIFSIVQDKQNNDGMMRVNSSDQKIVIALPLETYNQLVAIQNDIKIQPIIHSMVIIPALVHTIDELKIDAENMDDRENYRWFRSLRKACEKMDIKLYKEHIRSYDSLEIAQKLIDKPIVKGINYMMNGDL